MNKIPLKAINELDIKANRDESGKVISVVLLLKGYEIGNYNIKYFSKQAKEYIFSKFPEDLSSLEKELL